MCNGKYIIFPQTKIYIDKDDMSCTGSGSGMGLGLGAGDYRASNSDDTWDDNQLPWGAGFGNGTGDGAGENNGTWEEDLYNDE